MRLYYYVDPKGNFGDDLNPWLWTRLYPEILDGSDDELFVGIGTLINHRLPHGVPKHVFGSGFGYGDKPDLDDGFIFHAVRGPETARVLGISESLAITDAAVLIREVELPPVQVSRQKVGFIPHASSNHYYDWAGVCGELGFAYIDARQSVDVVLANIRSCDLLLCEAMHGAIVADALRVPWIPVVCYDYISEFKWRDWLASVGLEYAPHRITSLYHLERNWAPGKRFKIEVKRALYTGGLLRGRGWSPPPRRTGQGEYRCAVSELKAASLSRPYLSGDTLIADLTNRYVDTLAALKASQKHL